MGAERGTAAGQNKTGYAAVSGHILFCIFRIMEDWWEQAAFLGNSVCGAATHGGTQMRSGEPSTGWFPLSVCSPFRGERFAFLLAYGGLLARNAGRPPLSLRDISPAQRGNLPTPRRKLLKKLEQNFYVLLTFGFVLTSGTNPYTQFHTGNRGRFSSFPADPIHTYRPVQSGSIRCRPRVRLQCSP